MVDDDARLAASLRRALAYEGHSVEVAADGPGALVAARDRPPDLVVLDVMLPGLDGVEVCRRLREGSDVPILMLTARDAISDRVNERAWACRSLARLSRPTAVRSARRTPTVAARW